MILLKAILYNIFRVTPQQRLDIYDLSEEILPGISPSDKLRKDPAVLYENDALRIACRKCIMGHHKYGCTKGFM